MSRCSALSADNLGTARDLKAVVKEYCSTPEARRADDPTQLAPATQLKEPILLVAGLLRALNAATDGIA